MKNANYNLVKLLLNKLDDAWRAEKHYAKDARDSSCKECQKLIKRIVEEDRAHVEMLRAEVARHIKEKKFD